MQHHKRDESSKQASASGAGGKSNRSNKRNAPVQGIMSFVSFDANPTQEVRKAVRKQAALASAAARKATIAKKIAKQKEEAQRQGSNGPAGKTEDVGSGEKVVNARSTKRKRSLELPISRPGPGPSSVQYDDEQGKISVIASQESRPSAAYLTPAQSVHENELETVLDNGLTGPCRCPECTALQAARFTSSAPTAQRDMPWHSLSWRTQSEDYHKLAESQPPPSPASLPGPHSVGDGKPFTHYPVEYFPVFDKLLHHMLTIFAPRGWPTLKITQREGLEWEHWMTQISFKEPAFFYVRLLFASGDLIRLGQLESKVSDWLRFLAIKTINEALSDRERAISDGLILAIGRIALTESMYGDRHACTTIHRPAQKKMIDLRGGMGKLGFPPLVKKLMRWADNMMAIQSGTERILGEADETETSFGTKVGVDVMEKWAPHQGRALRKKIAISDLIT